MAVAAVAIIRERVSLALSLSLYVPVCMSVRLSILASLARWLFRPRIFKDKEKYPEAESGGKENPLSLQPATGER